MKTYLLDTSALLTLRDDEPGAGKVAELLAQAQKGKVRCFGCFISLMEVLYRVWKDEDKSRGYLAYQQVQSLPVVWINEDRQLLEKAAELKATHPLSLADAWIAASALLNDATLVHKDPEFVALNCKQLKLPFK